VSSRLPRGSLDAELILATAERLCGEHGLAGVTIRTVAAGLGVSHTAVHWHFAKREDLVQALLARAVRRFNAELPEVGDGAWDVELRAYWEGYRGVLRADAGLFELVVAQWATMAGSQAALDSSYARIDAQLGVLLGAGFSPRQAGYAYHLLSTYTRGCLVSEHQYARFRRERGHRDLDDRTDVVLPGDLSGFPHLSAAAAGGWSYTFATDADFSHGLDVVVAGLRSWVCADS
jgi:TetR/AcrR family tetracycline transcriptional repressor